MTRLGLERDIVDAEVLERSVGFFRERGIALPTFAQIAEPDRVPREMRAALGAIDADAADARNLFRVHWFNAENRGGRAGVPGAVWLPRELTGVHAPIFAALGDRFPMIRAHKVLAAYACLAPRLVTGQFDPSVHKAVWPSTGNYCRGGVAISRILGCRGVAVLPAGMSAERFEWLARWVADPSDVIRTPGTESNVKEIYDECKRLEADPEVAVFNQFCEFGNHLAHVTCTGPALERVFLEARQDRPELKLAAFVSATGSAGTIGAGDWLKDRHGTRIVAVEALECPTMLYNGFGEHNIQGIGDKHVPYIHNVSHTDVVVAISDRATDRLNVLFNTDAGRRWLAREHGLRPELVAALRHFGLSSICNVLAAIETAKALDLGPDDVVATVATDGAELYGSEYEKTLARDFSGALDEAAAAATFAEHLRGKPTEHLLVLTPRDRDRIFNLGYFTWVEQQGVSVTDFEARREQSFWRGLRACVPAWDALIEDFNRRTGALARA